MAAQGPTKQCPYCAEIIQAAAIKCKACGTMLNAPSAPEGGQEIRAEIRRLNLLSFVFGVPGLLIQGASYSMKSQALQTHGEAEAWNLGLVAGAALLITGLGFYARMKGRSGWWGLMGLLSCIGLIVLAVLPKKCRGCGVFGSSSATACTQCSAPM